MRCFEPGTIVAVDLVLFLVAYSRTERFRFDVEGVVPLNDDRQPLMAEGLAALREFTRRRWRDMMVRSPDVSLRIKIQRMSSRVDAA